MILALGRISATRAAALLLLAQWGGMPARSAGQSVAELLPRMTLEERFWQLFMLPGDLSDPTHDYSRGVFGLQIPPAPTARSDAERIAAVQRSFVEGTRLGVPIIPFEEAVHGLTRPGASPPPRTGGSSPER